MQSRSIGLSATSLAVFTLWSSPAVAQVPSSGSSLIMPGSIYMGAGIFAVVLTVFMLAVLSERVIIRLSRPVALMTVKTRPWVRTATSLASMCYLFGLIVIGFIGSADPLQNPLPLFFWTIWWVGFVVLHGFFGNLWYYLNPWTGLLTVTQHFLTDDSLAERTPSVTTSLNKMGMWPAIAVFLAFSLIFLAYPWPDDPFRLATIVLTYWVLTFIAMCWFGERAWLNRGEFISILLRAYSRLAPVGIVNNRLFVGLPGWQIVRASPNRTISLTTAIFFVLLLGSGSFDGFSKTFLWTSLIDQNPLGFSGRSAVIWPTTLGLFAANVGLLITFIGCVWIGNVLANLLAHNRRKPVSLYFAFRMLTVPLLPIAFAYHLAHCLISLLVNSQYALAAASDPLGHGADLLNLGQFHVTTGFLDSYYSAHLIWFFQVLVVVIGHAVSILIAHSIAIQVYGSVRRAIVSQLPVASFFVSYTCLGLWLLATPKVV